MVDLIKELKNYLNTHSEEEVKEDWNRICKETEDAIAPTADEHVGYLHVVEQTDAEKLEMYLKNCTKEELARMLIQANKEIEMMEKAFNRYSGTSRTY